MSYLSKRQPQKPITAKKTMEDMISASGDQPPCCRWDVLAVTWNALRPNRDRAPCSVFNKYPATRRDFGAERSSGDSLRPAVTAGWSQPEKLRQCVWISKIPVAERGDVLGIPGAKDATEVDHSTPILDQCRPIQLTDADKVLAGGGRGANAPVSRYNQMFSIGVRTGVRQSCDIAFRGVASAAGVDQVFVLTGGPDSQGSGIQMVDAEGIITIWKPAPRDKDSTRIETGTRRATTACRGSNARIRTVRAVESGQPEDTRTRSACPIQLPWAGRSSTAFSMRPNSASNSWSQRSRARLIVSVAGPVPRPHRQTACRDYSCGPVRPVVGSPPR